MSMTGSYLGSRLRRNNDNLEADSENNNYISQFKSYQNWFHQGILQLFSQCRIWQVADSEGFECLNFWTDPQEWQYPVYGQNNPLKYKAVSVHQYLMLSR